jgi:serine-type D-Ala-D-Ala carboxypeptidase/endopeptidase
VKEQIETIMAPLLTRYGEMGVVVGVIKGERQTVVGLGKSSVKGSGTPDGRRMFEIGSVTKVFTTTLLALMVSEGLVRVEMPVRELLQEFPNLSDEITLLRLATHTSDLPRMPGNFLWSTLRSPRNPYRYYGERSLHTYLKRYRPGDKRNEVYPYAYSNLGMGLLGYALARKLAVSYEEAIRAWIGGRLGMGDTGVTLTEDQQARLVTPHNEQGKATPLWDMKVLMGAGGLRSDIDDLLTFVSMHLDGPQSKLHEVLPLCHRVYVERPDEKIAGIALGWHISEIQDSSLQGYWHNGATNGCMGFIGFVKERGVGVVMLSNYGIGRDGGTDITAYGLKVLEKLAKQITP